MVKKIDSRYHIFLLFAFGCIIFLSAGCSSTRQTNVNDYKADKIISTARSYVGTPYLYGGTTRKG
ncbi:MAG: NlpC/P60 family protein, partial [bacterium]